MDTQFSRRQALAWAGAAVTAAALPWGAFAQDAATQPAPRKPAADRRFKVCGDDEFIGQRQDVKSFEIAQKCGLDGVSLDMGRMPRGQPYVNKLLDDAQRQQFIDKSKATGVEIACLSWFALYAHVMPKVDKIDQLMNDWVDLMVKMNVKVGFLPLQTKDGTLAEPEHADVYKDTVAVLKAIAPKAEKAGVILGVESNIDADGYKKFFDAVGSPAVQAFYNPGDALEHKFDPYADLKALGKSRVCGLHLEQGSVPPETFEHRLGEGPIDFKKLRETLLDMDWGGWMSIARSRQKGTERKLAQNMTANAAYVHSVFPE